MRPELIVAGKEFRDHVTSRRFLLIFAILLAFSAYSIVSGMDQYNKTLDSYKQNQQQDWYKQMIRDLQDQIAKAQASGDSPELIDSLQAQLDSYINPSMPSVMTYFYQLNLYFGWICALLAIAIGFDLITREKEEGSLKSLLSHPVYRDSVINGKTLGAITVLVTAVGATFLITIAIVLFFGVVPSFDDLLRIAAYFVAALLLCMAFFAVAMAASTLARNSSMAVLYALGIVVVLVGLTWFTPQIVSFVSGPPPQSEGGPIVYMKGGAAPGAEVAVDLALARSNTSGPSSSTDPAVPDKPLPTALPGDTPVKPGEPDVDAWQKYYEKQEMIRKALQAVSPITNFQYDIANALIYDTSSSVRPLMVSSKIMPGSMTGNSNVWEALGSVWVNLVVLFAEILAAFAVAYVKFLRTDIR